MAAAEPELSPWWKIGVIFTILVFRHHLHRGKSLPGRGPG
jgi:lysozyme family protein